MDSVLRKDNIITIILVDIIALVFIYFIPALSHLMKVPLYYADPMRIALFSVFILTKKENAYIMALSIPVLSFIISGHPVFPKFILVSLELFINVLLIYRFSRFIRNKMLLVLLSVLLSKSVYYLLKYVLIRSALLDSGLISTPLYIQAIVMIILSFILGLILKEDRIQA